MPVTDPIADMLTRIRNAVARRHTSIEMPFSKIKVQLLQAMLDEGFIKNFKVVTGDHHPTLEVELRYYSAKDGAIHGLKRVSKPGLRTYVGRHEIPSYYSGIGVPFLSTSKGILTGARAKRENVGGELLYYVW